MKSFYTTLIIALSSFSAGLACSCVYIPTFCETITYGSDSIDSSYLIVHAKVESKSNDEMKIRVLTTLFGTPDGSVLTIPQGYGADCRENIDRFNEDAEYLFALRGSNDPGYNLSICGVNYLDVSGNEIIGNIAPGVSRIKISEFPEINDCGGIGTELAFLDVTPTLTSGDFEISTTKDIEKISISIYDMIGRIIYTPNDGVLFESIPLVIPGHRFPSGCYTVVTEVAGIRRTFRVVITS